jgi:hypothetical protein
LLQQLLLLLLLPLPRRQPAKVGEFLINIVASQ